MSKKSLELIDEALQFVFGYASHIDEWIIIKKEMLKALAPEERKLFSTRHPLTKRQMTNDLERSLAEKWSTLSGRPVVFTEDGKQGTTPT